MKSIVIPASQPYATYTLVGLLAAIYAYECALNFGSFEDMATPPIGTLVGMGGIKQSLIVSDHEWYRLLTAIFLHASLQHILWNGLALLIAGGILERLLGRLHFLALFVMGGLGGSLASTLWNPPNWVSVGASGAIAACFAAMMLLAFRIPSGAIRSQMWKCSLYILLPSVVPLLNSASDMNIDYADHVGGILAGLAACGLFYTVWPEDGVRPGGRWVSTVILTAGLAGLTFGVVALALNVPRNVQEFSEP